jgi:hypothetical protein
VPGLYQAKPLARLLVEERTLSAERRTMLEPIVQDHVK